MDNHRSVYFLSGCRAGTTFEYRVLQKQEQLSLFGIQSIVEQRLFYTKETLKEALSHDVIFLYRVAYSRFIEEVIQQARGRHIPVVFGVDDLVFEPTVVNDPVRKMSHDQAAHYYEGSWRYRQALIASDYVVTSTEYLTELARKLGKTAFVHRNGLSKWMIDAAEELVPQRTPRSSRDNLIIGYSSGTATHDQDFLEAAPALAQIFDRYPDVELHILGPLVVPPELERFGDRIRNLGLQPWDKVFGFLNTFDINLGPLEQGNPFCHAKSEVKYTEAAVLGIPTIASRIDPFEYAIRDGENGFLAGDTKEWVEKLDVLLSDHPLRHRMGETAHRDVMARYAPDVLGQELVQTFDTIQERYRQEYVSVLDVAPEPKDVPLILNWIITEPTPGSGGHTDIIRMVNLLASFGHQINAYIVPRQRLADKSDWQIREYIRENFADIEGSVIKWSSGSMVEADSLILTHWTTAYEIDDAPSATKTFYFVQDWEPFFNPMGTKYLRAEQTYKMGFFCITLGQWLTDYLREMYNADADYFDLAVDHAIYYPRPVEKPSRPRVCFYARPSTPRRLFPLGVEALALIYQARPDVEFVLYGAEDTDLNRQDPIPFPYINRGILKEQELAELFSSSHVSVVLSPTNCSLVPPEVMACKSAVVDLNRDTVRGVLEHEVNALLAEPTPAAISEAVLRLLDDEPLRERLIENAYQQVQQLSWSKSARRVEEIMYQKLPSTRRVLAPHKFEPRAKTPALENLPPQQRQHLDAIHRKRRRPLSQSIALAKSVVKRLLRIDRNLGLNGTPILQTRQLAGHRRIGQTFVAKYDGLYRIDVLVSANGRRNTRDLIFHLKESPQAQADLAVVHLNSSLLLDRNYASFVFEPQSNSRGKSFYFYLESPESVLSDSTSLWYYRSVEIARASLYHNDRPIEGQLVFGLHYMDEQLGEIGERPIVLRFDLLTNFWQRLRMAFHMLRQRDLARLRWEVTRYLLWKISGEQG
jgi:glycosyltransferase involved in cell wall biosynthesis